MSSLQSIQSPFGLRVYLRDLKLAKFTSDAIEEVTIAIKDNLQMKLEEDEQERGLWIVRSLL